MAVRQYIGARYVTKIYENSLDPSSAEWEAGVSYEPLVLVTYMNGSYLSKKTVPGSIGDPTSNPQYWVQTGYYNGQIASLQAQIDAINAVMATKTDMLSALDAYQVMNNLIYQLRYVDWTGVSTYNSLQGGCYNSARNTFVMGIIQSGTESNGILVEVQPDFTTVVQTHAYPNNEIRHCNDMTYNPLTNKLYVAGYETNSTNNSIIVFDADTLAFIEEKSFAPASDAGHAISKITYDRDNNRYITMSNYDIMIYDASFNLVSTTPFELQDFALNPFASINFRPLQSIEYYNDKIYALYTILAANTGSAAVVIYNLDGTVEASFPVSLFMNEMESEFITLYGDKLKIVSGCSLGVLTNDFNISNVPYGNIGKDFTQQGVILKNVNLNDLYLPGIYDKMTTDSVTNGPFEHFILYVLPQDVGVVQIAIRCDGECFIATRHSSYVGAWSDWIYSPSRFMDKGKTYTFTDTLMGSASPTGTEVAFYLNTAHFQNNIADADISVPSFSLYSGTADGVINITSTNFYVVGCTIMGRDCLQIRIKKNDNSSFISSGGTPVQGVGSITMVIA